MRDRLLWTATALYAAVFFALGWMRYNAHRNYVDLGIFAQTAASAFGCFCNAIEGSHWAFHFSPVLYLAGALLLFWHSALALVALQAAAGALTAPPVYALVRRRTDIATARWAAAVVLLYPALWGLTFGDFHEDGLAPAAVAWLLWAFDGARVGWTLFFALLVLAIKEDQALFLAFAGVLGAMRYRRDPVRARLALGIGGAALIVFAVFFLAIEPHARANAHWAPVRFYAWSGADVRALVPAGIGERLGFLLLAFVPLLFIPFRTPAMWLAVPPLAEVLLSRMSTTYTMGSHYAGAWIGYALFAFALGVGDLYGTDPRRTRRALQWCVALCALELLVADPLHPGQTLRSRAAAGVQLDAFVRGLPPHLDVATQEEVYTHLAATDPNATLLPESSEASVDACYILTDAAYPTSPRLVEAGALVRRLVRAGVYRLVRRDGPISLYRSVRCR